MSRISWVGANNFIEYDEVKIYKFNNSIHDQNSMDPQFIQTGGIKKSLKLFLWPFYKVLTDFLFDGYIEKFANRMIKRHLHDDAVFVEVACGDMSLANSLPKSHCYNAFDFILKDFYVDCLKNKGREFNLALSAAENIPIQSSSIDMVVCMQSFIHFMDFEKSMGEITRIMKNSGILICSISNNYCNLYKENGPHPQFTFNWTYDEFVNDLRRYGFGCIHSERRGMWIRFPKFVTKRVFSLPIIVPSDEKCLTYLFVFQKQEN